MKAGACCLIVLTSVNPPMGEALCNYASEGNFGAGGVTKPCRQPKENGGTRAAVLRSKDEC
jgi:hypothetical protein